MAFDPTEHDSTDSAARSRFEMDREFGIPSKPYPNDDDVGRRANELHYRREAEMRDEFGWHGTTREQLRRQWGLS